MAGETKSYISKVTLPSVGTTGITYYLKDEEARDMISGGISFNIVWTAADYASSTAPTVEKLATIPAGTEVAYNNGESTATGTLIATKDTKAIFYLIYSKTQAGNLDVYNEYVTVTNSTTDPVTYFWEKIGDTQIDLSNVVTDVTLNPQTTTIHNPGTPSTDSVIGANSTFTITQPTIKLETGATAGTGVIGVATGITSVTNPTISLSAETTSGTGRQQYVQSVATKKISATASGGSVSASGDNVTAVTGYANPTTDEVLGSGTQYTVTQPTVALSTGATAGTGVISVATGIGNATTKYLSASASGTTVGANGTATAVTGYANPTTTSAASSVTPSNENLDTTTIYGVQNSTTSVIGVQSSTTTASKATVGTATSQTTATGGSTASTSNTDFLKGISVSNETLIFGAATLNTQTTSIPNVSFSDVTVPIKNTSSTTVPIKASSSTTVATGTTSAAGTGDAVVVDVSVGDIVTVLTGLGTPSTKTVLTGVQVTAQPTITLTANNSNADGRITYVQAQGTANTTNIKATASGTAVSHTSDDLVDALTGLGTASTDTVLGTSSTFSVTPPTVTVATGTTGDTDVVVSGTTKYMAGSASGTAVTPTTTNIKATASGANTAWNNKDAVNAITSINTTDATVLNNTTTLTVVKGGASE